MDRKTILHALVCAVCLCHGFYASAQISNQRKLTLDSLFKLSDSADLPTPQRFYYAQQAYNVACERRDKKKMFNAQLQMALLKKELQQFSEAFFYLQNTHVFAQKERQVTNQMIALSYLGMLHADVSQFEKAQENYLKMSEIAEKNDSFYHNYIAKLNLSDLFYKQKNARKTIEYAESARDNAYKARRYCKGVAASYTNLASGYFLEKQYGKARYFLDSAQIIVDTMTHLDASIAADLYWRKGELSKEEGKKVEAIHWFERCAALHQDCEKEARKHLIGLYTVLGDNANATKSYRAVMDLDSANLANLTKESAKNITSVSRLSEEKQRNNDLENERFRLYISCLIGFLIVLAFYQQSKNMKVRKTLLKSQLAASEAARQLQASEQAKLQQVLAMQQEELKNRTLEIARKNEFLADLEQKIATLNAAMNKANIEELQDLVRQNALNNEKDIVEVKWQVDAWNSIFYEKLRHRVPELSATELEICGLIRLNLSSKEIASIRNIESKSVDMSRYRLRKKMNLKPEDDLILVLQNI
jgi:DNA-binding CsgD family transcriptional regulator